jgi:iron complex outermembrane receptor protein
MFYIKADWQLSPRWSVFVQNKWISELTRSPMANGNQDPRPAVDPYSISDMYILGKNLIPGLELGFKVTNVFDHQAYAPAPEGIPGDYPLQGRAWYLSANYRWQD